MSTSHDRIAIVVVHGMGNQFPMDTLRGFANSLKTENEIEYSSPNRITKDTETRRLSFSGQPYDFFEYYWAPYVDEPGITETMIWVIKLLFFKNPSQSISSHINSVRLMIVLFLLPLVLLAFGGYNFLQYLFKDPLSATLLGTAIALGIKTCWELISGTLVSVITKSVGDVVKYTIPSPANIESREKIRKNGIALLKNLHEAKKPNGDFKYCKIVVVAHSLGTMVSYDILASLFAQYHYKYSNIPDKISQEKLDELKKLSTKPDATYQKLQGELFKEYRRLGNEWRVSNFITMGSPLTHAPMLIARSEKDFERKKNQREYPTSPPQLDAIEKHFAFDEKFERTGKDKLTGKDKDPRNIMILNHSAHFAETQWTNIYFENDWIGGKLSDQFGAGIKDEPIKAVGRLVSHIPLLSHTKYWDVRQATSLKVIKNIFDEIKNSR